MRESVLLVPFPEVAGIVEPWLGHSVGARPWHGIPPHVTVAWGAKLDEAEADVVPRLPLRGRAREAVLLTEVEPQRWEPQARFPFRET